MSQPIPLVRESFKHGLSALLQRIHRPGIRVSASDWNDPHTLPGLLQIQQKIKSGELDLDAIIDRVVKLAWKALRAEGSGVWLFANNEIFYCAGAGEASNDERLRLTVLSRLAAADQFRKYLRTDMGNRAEANALSDAGPDLLDYPESVLIEPISQGQKIAGVLAAFSSGADRFTERDAAKIQLLADLLAQALGKVADEASQYVALEPTAMLELVEGMIPALQKMLSCDERSGRSPRGFLHATTWTDSEPASSELADDSATSPLDGEASVPGAGEQMMSESDVPQPSIPQVEARPRWGSPVSWAKNRLARGLDEVIVAGGAFANHMKRVVAEVWQTVPRNPPLSQLDLPRPPRFFVGVRAGASSHLKAWFRSRPIVHTAVPVFVALLVTVGFLTSKAGLGFLGQPGASISPTKPEKTVAADAEGSASRETAQSDDITTLPPREANVTQPTAALSPFQVSHLRVTDRRTQQALRSLSHYELAALRRRALYGDDLAELLMGMAYETGYGLQQNCNSAAEWVTKAATQGNPAAEYNLGLRYRDGDGVPVNQEAALKWLRKAAEQHFFGAQVALMAVTER